MTEMIERVARHLFVLHMIRHAGFDPAEPGAVNRFEQGWRACDQARYERDAASTVEAMRKPTVAMIEAFEILGYVDGEGQDPVEAWQAMIDAALGTNAESAKPKSRKCQTE